MRAELWRHKFEARIDRSGECWVWTGERTATGHGRVRVNSRKVIVSRIVLEEKLGRPLLPGEVARHTCDNPPCARAEHLEVGSVADNNRDRDERGRQVTPRGGRNGARTHPESRRGERNPRARLTPIGVRAIRDFVAHGYSDTQIAAQLGCSRGAVYHVRIGRTWSHIS